MLKKCSYKIITVTTKVKIGPKCQPNGYLTFNIYLALHGKIIFLYGFCKDINDVSLCQILLLQTQKRLRYDNLRTKLTNHCHSAECKIICPCVIQSMIESKLKEVNCHISVVFVSKAIKFGIVIHRLYLYKIRIKILSFHARPNRY